MRKVVALLAFLLFAAQALAQGDPETAYKTFHQALLGPFSPQHWISYLPAAKRERFQRDVQASLKWVNTVQSMRDEMPRVYRITAKTAGADGKSVRLATAGQGKSSLGKPRDLTGSVELVEEGGVWKINEVTWGVRKLE